MSILQKFFGSKNERTLKKLQPQVHAINELSGTFEKKTDSELKAMTGELRQRIDQGAGLDDILVDAFATVREAAFRTLKMRHFDVQLLGGMVLHSGRIAEMRTGEGKTLTATLPCYLNALSGKGVHLVTVNDYLASRDADWMGQVYRYLGLEVGTIVHGIQDWQRQRAYQADITYGQNSEFGFDYLRDNMKVSPGRMVQRPLNYGIVDEVDSILIDEARTPLIISGPAEQSAALYVEVDKVVPRLKRDIDYTVDEKAHSVILTDSGVEKVEKVLGLTNLYDPANIAYNHHVNQALRAHTLYKRDVKYLVEDGKVLIVDEFTGRKMPGRRWSDGLHQAIEAKEGVVIEEENQTLATITYQNFFRMYEKLSGMTGTADTEASEFHHIYKLEVVVVPTNRPIQRADEPDLIYKNEKGKFLAVTTEIEESHAKGQPVLVGTTSVEKSEIVASQLRKKNIPFEVLNAKQHEREALVVAQAGRKGAITISTNMAGRGTDIVLGGNAEHLAEAEFSDKEVDKDSAEFKETLQAFQKRCTAEREEVLAAGGLKIVGTERHESRRIDNQLRGRAGRQGDAGAARFYLSLDDDLMRIFGAERITGLMERLGMEDDVPIEHSWVTKSIENAQKKVEGQHFDSRKNVLEYDDVMNQQRKAIYGLRKQILTGRYFPTLSEEEEKAGKKPEPPTSSGDWTMESLAAEAKEQVSKIVAFAEEDQKERDASTVNPDDIPEDMQEPPVWRKLRGEIWRQTGAWCEDVEKLWNRSHAELTQSLVEQVSASWIQQRERLLDLADSSLGHLIGTYCPNQASEDAWDLAGLKDALREHFAIDFDPPKGMDLETLAEEAWERVAKRLDEREEELGRAWLMYFARHFYLEEIDKQWIDHLKMMDQLREGISLRGYGQKDPKKEYKKEGFDLFSEMMLNIDANAQQKIFRVEVEREEANIPALQAKERKTVERHPSSAEGDSEAAGSNAFGKAADGGHTHEKQKTVRRDKPKVGRNDPCPCGSGKKYKKCHGKAGAEAAQ